MEKGNWINGEGVRGLVSVIIPTYNRGKLLDDAIKSVVDQTYRPIEICISDGNSSDSTSEVVAKWGKRLRSQEGLTIEFDQHPNRGASAARNEALLNSTGEFIQFLDSDDVLHHKKVEIHVSALHRYPSLDHVWSDLVHVPSEEILDDHGAGESRIKVNDAVDKLEKMESTPGGSSKDFIVEKHVSVLVRSTSNCLTGTTGSSTYGLTFWDLRAEKYQCLSTESGSMITTS
ncbi:glycosyltransferase family A protein [Salinibacter ruber]|uniref:Glycosyltransferase involved in cell wall biosynthesis n=1 Tax=Salinibacter ruber TaxID=146919 RepID=A0A9X2V7E1_9BACT|nr:glycosyltransferase family A protein [Salinibacter ruber]MCS4122736.1 glycosyltransferase involved in cell wall biosynthesis [Salinibacter ruber]